MANSKKYIFDANCFIEPWNKFYSYDFFKPFWDEFVKNTCQDGVMLIQQEIYDEIIKKDDRLADWLKQQNFSIIATDVETARSVTNINEQFRSLVKESKGRSLADPFIIALAQREGAIVVTLEDHGSEAKPKIPYVCDALKVKCINLFDFIKENDVQFGLR